MNGTAEAAAAEIVDRARSEPKSVAREYAETILICVIFVIFSRAFVFQQSKIPSGSMMDTLLIGDYIMVNRFVYAGSSFDWERKLLPVRDLRRGDVVVFRMPREPEVDYIKRLIGLPGDVVEVRQGRVYVNGELLDEPYVKDDYRRGVSDMAAERVRADHYFVMGDHRNASYDSREWGQVPRRLIKGRALLIWYSFPEEHAQSTEITRRMKSWVEKIVYFPFRSRWSRCFTLIR
ncbi:MAG TPA: signal peptidase I [Candidatus Polarisedimenticolaceae bacterium]|nr:signal peptidase I [Candidatus Polarisedimenticolaceae bacterium]